MDIAIWLFGFSIGMITAGLLVKWAYNSDIKNGYGMNSIMNLVIEFVKIAKDLRPKYIEDWIEGKVNDFDMDMLLIEEKKHRVKTYKNLLEFDNRTSNELEK